ncbi:methyl-accepting chemotaxis protein, partial [Helicobacter typhlonius]
MGKSLVTKLIGVVVGIFIILIATLSFFNYKNTSNDVSNIYKGLQQLALSSSYTTINITMNIEAKQHLDMLAEYIGQLDENDIIAQREMLFHIAELVQYPSVYITYEETGKTLTEDFVPHRKTPLSRQWDDKPDLRGRNWYVATKNANGLLVTPSYVSQVGANKGKILSTAAIPFYKNGKFAGVIAVDIFVDGFQERFKNFKRPELPSMEVFIADNTGYIFSREHPIENTNGKPTPLEDALLQALKSNSTGEIEFDNFGTKRIAYYKQFPFGWTIVVAANKSDYQEATNKNFIFTIVLSLVLLVIGVVVLFVIIKILIAPVKTIKDGLLTFFAFLNYETNTAPVLKVSSQDELGEMAQAINNNVKKTQEGLEQDQKLVKQSLQVIERAKQGYTDTLIELKGHNPELNKLRDSMNDLLELLQNAVGKNLPEIVRVFDSYTKLDFTTEVKDASGRVEVVTNTLGEEIRKMLSTSAAFAQTLGNEAQGLQEAV